MGCRSPPGSEYGRFSQLILSPKKRTWKLKIVWEDTFLGTGMGSSAKAFVLTRMPYVSMAVPRMMMKIICTWKNGCGVRSVRVTAVQVLVGLSVYHYGLRGGKVNFR